MATQPVMELEPVSTPARPSFRLPRMQEAGLIVVIVLLGLFLTFAGGWINYQGERVNNFFRLSNIMGGVLTPMSMIAVMTVGQTFVIISGGIDISVASIMTLSALGGAAVLQLMPPGTPAWEAIPVGIGVPCLIGTLCGLLNGALIVGLRMHPFIVTLGTMSIFRGICNVAVTIKNLPNQGRSFPDSFTTNFFMWTPRPNVQPWPMIVMLLCVAAGFVYLRLMVVGRENYAVGGNEEAARFSGLSVGRVKLMIYALSGLSAGIAGTIYIGYYGAVSTNAAQGWELTVIAAAVVGGASLTGGRGTAIGALLGAIVIQLISNGIFILNARFPEWVKQDYSMIIIGTSIIVAVAVDRLSEHLQNRRLMRAVSK